MVAISGFLKYQSAPFVELPKLQYSGDERGQCLVFRLH